MRVGLTLIALLAVGGAHGAECVSFELNGQRVIGIPGADGARTAIVSKAGTVYVYAAPGAITGIRPLSEAERALANAAEPVTRSSAPENPAAAPAAPPRPAVVVDEAYVLAAAKAPSAEHFPLRIHRGRIAVIAIDPNGAEVIGLEDGEVWLQVDSDELGAAGRTGIQVYIHPIAGQLKQTLQIDPERNSHEITAMRIK